MRAAVVRRYGPPDVVEVVDVPTPRPGRDQVLVRVQAAAVSSGDARIRGARFPRGFAVPGRLALGLTGPRRPVLGITFSGRVETVGERVTDLHPGDEVAGMSGARMGTHAEYVVVPAARAVRKPAGVSHEDAAGVLFGGTTALHYLTRRATVTPGASVLVNGASGAVGTNAVQLARHLGARVTAVTSGRNAELVTGLGADRVVDHTSTDVTTLTERFDVVLDAVGNLSPAAGRPLLTGSGVLLLVVAGLWDTVTARGQVRAGPAPEKREDVERLLSLMAGHDLRVVLDRVLPLEEIVEAYRVVDSGHKVGNVLVQP